MIKSLIPFGNRVIVKLHTFPEKEETKIFIPSSGDDVETKYGQIVYLGNISDEDKDLLKVGSIIVFSNFEANKLVIPDDEITKYFVIETKNILAIINN